MRWFPLSPGRLRVALMLLPVLAIPPVGMLALGSDAPEAKPPTRTAAAVRCDVGVNLGAISYYSPEYVFLDRFKETVSRRSSGWMGVVNGKPVSPELGAQGYPVAMPEGATSLMIAVKLDPIVRPTTDRYVLTYEGTGTFGLLASKIVKRSKGRIVFDFQGTKHGTALLDRDVLTLTNIDASDPVHDIHIVRADQVDLYNAGEIFNPAFLEDVATWGAVRFMDWGAINGSQVADWADRAHVDDSSYGGTKGVPIEVMVALANQTHTDMWYNIPAHADDDYIRNAVQYIKDHLDPSLTLHLEYSNEVWNWSFEQASYARDQANLLWGNDANHDGQYTGSEAVEAGNLVYYGYRAAQMAVIARDVYGSEADTRLINVLSAQTAWLGAESYVFKGVARAEAGDVAQLFGSWAITGYFGNGLSTAAGTPAAAATVIGWAKSGDAGLDAAFKELEFGGSIVKDSLAWQAQNYAYWAGVAAKNGLTLDVYEAGAHLVSQRYGADQALVQDFFTRLIDDPRMGDLYAKNVAAFSDEGGSLFTQYVQTAGPSPSGYWGTLPGTYADHNSRWDAYANAQASCRSRASS